MIDLSTLSPKLKEALRQSCVQRMEMLRQQRLSWFTHWGMLADMYLPRRYRWLVSPNQYSRGVPINSQIVDETGVIAARTLASGMLSGLTSPTKPWFRLGLHGMENIEQGPVKIWLAECGRRLAKAYAESNFYQALGTCYHDLAVFASASLIQYEDDEDVFRFYNPCLGEFMFGINPRLVVDVHYREFTYTLQQCVDQFGINNIGDSLASLYRGGAQNKDIEVIVGNAIEPNDDLWATEVNLGQVVPAKFKFREVFWLQPNINSAQNSSICQVSGYVEKPFIGARWDVTSNDAYGRGPGMDALPAVRQLQIEQKRKAEAIDKMVRPPMVASVTMKNEPMSILPGAVNYAADVANSGFKPAYQIDPRIAEMMEDIKEVTGRINSVFFVDLFLMISQLDTVRTATEIDARREEKLIQLGPVIERFENEVLDPIIDRSFAIMMRRGLFPPPPPEIAGMEINVQYISMLAEAQRAASTTAIERLVQFVGSQVAVSPQSLDILDLDEVNVEYADLLATSPKLLRDPKAIEAIRAARGEQQRQMQALQIGTAAAQGAETLSNTQVGGGKSALEAMING